MTSPAASKIRSACSRSRLFWIDASTCAGSVSAGACGVPPQPLTPSASARPPTLVHFLFMLPLLDIDRGAGRFHWESELSEYDYSDFPNYHRSMDFESL